MKKMFSILFAFLLLLLCGCQKETVTPNWAAAENKASAPSADASGWQEKYDLGVRYLNDGNYEEAVIAFTAAIEIDPKRPEGYAARGGAYLSMAQASGDAATSCSSGFSAAASPGRQVCEKITGRATEKCSDATSRNHAALSSPVIIPISI